MSWQARYLPASFRGVPFEVSAATRGSGRVLVSYEYDGVDAAEYDDRRRRTPVLSVEAWLSGDDVWTARDALETALDATGPGVLVHPTRGTLLCYVGPYETTDEGGSVVRFQIEFRPVLQLPQRQGLDVVSMVAAGRDNVFAASLAAFTAAWDVGAGVAYVSAAMRDVRAVTSALRKAVTAPATYVAAAGAVVNDQLDRIEQDLDAIVRSPASLGAALTGALAGITDFGAHLVVGPLHGMDALAAAAGPALDDLELSNRRALERHVGRSQVAQVSLVAVETDWATADEALAARDLLSRLFDDMADEADHVTQRAQSPLQGQVLAYLLSTAARLPRLVTVTPEAPIPALVLAHDLYGDARRVDELVQRARVSDPLMLPASPLQVVSP